MPLQFGQAQFHCGRPPPAAEPRTLICIRQSDDPERLGPERQLQFSVGVRANFAIEVDLFVLRGGPFHGRKAPKGDQVERFKNSMSRRLRGTKFSLGAAKEGWGVYPPSKWKTQKRNELQEGHFVNASFQKGWASVIWTSQVIPRCCWRGLPETALILQWQGGAPAREK
jgi:hypothetical protein